MSVATSIPCIRLPTSSSCCSSSSASLRLSTVKTCMSFTTIRSSQTDGPIRRPVAPAPPLQPSPSQPSNVPASPPLPKLASVGVMVEDKSVVTLEFQRAKARELQEYLKQKKLEDAALGPAFGFVGKNEINNGRRSDMHKSVNKRSI